MDFDGVAQDTAEQLTARVNNILAMDISPDVKTDMIAKLVNLVGQRFITQMYGVVSEILDSTAIQSLLDANENGRVEDLAKKIVRDSAFSKDDSSIIKEYLDSTLGKAEYQAFANAVSLEKHPTLRRILRGETCQWCRDRVGTFVEPEQELFQRHDNCDCLFIVSGWKTRNGVLKNYRKG